MNTKLTLKLNKQVIHRAKRLAANKNMSVSKIVENYLNYITNEKINNIKITPLVKSLSGVIKLSGTFDYKKEYKSYLSQKYK